MYKTLSNKEIVELLPNKRVYFLHANSPNKSLYVEYEIVGEYGDEYSENKEDYTYYTVQVDIFSTGDYTEVERVIKKNMIAAGFNRDMSADMYEKDTGLYHCAMRFNISLPTSEN